MKKYNIEFEKYNYYLKYTFIKFLIYLSQISIIIISPFIFKSMNPFLFFPNCNFFNITNTF